MEYIFVAVNNYRNGEKMVVASFYSYDKSGICQFMEIIFRSRENKFTSSRFPNGCDTSKLIYSKKQTGTLRNVGVNFPSKLEQQLRLQSVQSSSSLGMQKVRRYTIFRREYLKQIHY